MDPLVRIITLTVFAFVLVAAGAVLARFLLACPFCGRTRKDGPLPGFTCGEVRVRKDHNRQWAASLPGHGPILFTSKESALEYVAKELTFELARIRLRGRGQATGDDTERTTE
jgi:hypothetical protein